MFRRAFFEPRKKPPTSSPSIFPGDTKSPAGQPKQTARPCPGARDSLLISARGKGRRLPEIIGQDDFNRGPPRSLMMSLL